MKSNFVTNSPFSGCTNVPPILNFIKLIPHFTTSSLTFYFETSIMKSLYYEIKYIDTTFKFVSEKNMKYNDL